MNAVTIVLGDTVLEAAKAADRALAAGGELKPLHGVPFTGEGEHRPRRYHNHSGAKEDAKR